VRVPSFLPREWAKTVVPVEVKLEDEDESFQPIGSGVVVHWHGSHAFVTARHIVERDADLYLSFNSTDGGVGRMPLSIYKQLYDEWNLPSMWHFHSTPDVDLAVMPCFIPNADFTQVPLESTAFLQDFDESQEVLFLSFPLGISLVSQVRAIVRGGVVALKREDGTFLIDGNIFPGSSGGAVFLKPDPADIQVEDGKLVLPPPRFIGIISAYLPYTDTAISSQTGNLRVTFEENSGLGLVSSTDQVRDIVSGDAFQTTWEALKAYVLEHAGELTGGVDKQNK